jgi:hypothetical protein
VCGNGFHARSDAEYCSSACRPKAHPVRTAYRISGLADRRHRHAALHTTVGAALQRAQHEYARALDLRRLAADTLKQVVAARQLLTSRQNRVNTTGNPDGTAPCLSA